MITFLILIGPIPLLILYAAIRKRLKGQEHPPTQTQVPAPGEKPYEPEAPRRANALLRRFPLATRLYLQQQWTLARFGFIASLWILTVPVFGLLPLAHKVPAGDQPVWMGVGIPAFVAFIAALVAGSGIAGSAAAYTRTRPIPIRIIFWGRILSALAVLLLAAVVSMGIAFSALHMAYGPAWTGALTSAKTSGLQPQDVIHPRGDEETEQTGPHHPGRLAQNPAPRILASSITTMTLSFSAFVLLFSPTFRANRTSASGAAIKWMVWMVAFGGIFAFNTLESSSSTESANHIAQLFFYSLPSQPSPPWRFLPVPIVLSMTLLFLCERLYLRRDN